jgi:mRNA interferase MazF
MTKQVKRGEVYYADLSPVVGAEQGGVRPVVIIQNDRGNRNSPTVIVAPITTKVQKATLPTHVRLTRSSTALPHDSLALLEQLRTIDKSRLQNRLTKLPAAEQAAVDRALALSVGLLSLNGD